ncbi:MAG: hypothetical protein AB7N24_03545 [Dehalococcoidia bacterium]
METQPRSLSRGFIIESANIPAGFGAHLERKGLAGMTAATLDGMYLEPRVPLGEIFRAFERTGAQVVGVRRAGQPADWHITARAAAGSRMRLSNMRAAEWLPTLPAA